MMIDINIIVMELKGCVPTYYDLTVSGEMTSRQNAVTTYQT
jgi:hypothetical protein